MKAEGRRLKAEGILWFILLPSALCLLPSAAKADVAVFLTGGKSITTWHGQADVQSMAFESTRRRFARTDLGWVIASRVLWQPRSWFGYEFGDGNERVRAISASVIARRRFFASSSRLQPYVEASIGPMWAEKAVPAATSRFNFVTEPGLGFVVRPRSRHPLMIGYRFSHLSNGGYSPRNPGLNISSVVVGTIIRK
jgi:hypothetical protein